MSDAWEIQSERLLAELQKKGVEAPTLELLQRVPRHKFVPEHLRNRAYEDRPLTIGSGQTISQPYIVALMTQAADLRSSDRVLEVGTGSGYQTAVLAEAAARVYTIERLPELLQKAYNVLTSLGYDNVQFRLGDGTLGWEEEAPFDRIMVTAAAPSIPDTLLRQLAPDGRMVIPVGEEREQQLLLIRKSSGSLQVDSLCPCAFVRLIGKEGYEGGPA